MIALKRTTTWLMRMRQIMKHSFKPFRQLLFFLLVSPCQKVAAAFSVVRTENPQVATRRRLQPSAAAVVVTGFQPHRNDSTRLFQVAAREQEENRNQGGVLWESLKLRLFLVALESSGLVKPEDLPYQTIGLILNFMNKLFVYDLMFAPYWKERLEDCAHQVLDHKRPALRRVPSAQDLQGTTWRLAYTNDFTIMPQSRRLAYLSFRKGDDDSIHYSFHSDKKGFTDVEAECSYQIGPNGTVVYTFDKVTKDGHDLMTGRIYGMRQGSTRTIHTAFFDGQIWIDRSDDGSRLTIYSREYGK